MRDLSRWVLDVIMLAITIAGIILIANTVEVALEVPRHIIHMLP